MVHENSSAREIPLDRRCVQLTLTGYPCGLKTVAGQDRCFIHGLYRALDDGRSTIDIPLLEDEHSILYVYSQVARALAQGSMPAANANGILRCCRGAQRLLEEKWKRERLKEKQDRQSTARSAGASASHPEPDQTRAANLENSADTEADTETGGTAAADDSSSSICDLSPARETHAVEQPSALQATSCCGDNDDQSEEPQPWTIEPQKEVLPPPQFADAREKFQRALDRVSNQQTDAVMRRNRAIRARGGSALDFYEKRGQGVRCDIRD